MTQNQSLMHLAVHIRNFRKALEDLEHDLHELQISLEMLARPREEDG